MAAAVAVAGTLLALGPAPAPAPASAVGSGRRPQDRTLVLGPGSGFMVDEFASDATRQQLSVSDAALADGSGSAKVTAYDPGTFDPGSLPRGRPVLLAGQEAWYVTDPAPTLTWRGAAGTWLAVTGAVDWPVLGRLARAVRLNPATPVAGPVGLSWLPTGLALTSARIGTGTTAEIFTARGRRSYDVRLSVYPVASNDWTNGTLGLGPPTIAVARYRAWYAEDTDDNSQLVVEAGSCGVRVQVSDRARVPLQALERMLAGAEIGSCDDVDNWPPILS